MHKTEHFGPTHAEYREYRLVFGPSFGLENEKPKKVVQ